MDTEGFVQLDVIGRFNRVRALTQDLNLIREVGVATFWVGVVYTYTQWVRARSWGVVVVVMMQ